MVIKKARKKKRLSVEDFAKKNSKKESVIKKLEKEAMNPPMNLVRKVQRELGVNKLEEADKDSKNLTIILDTKRSIKDGVSTKEEGRTILENLGLILVIWWNIMINKSERNLPGSKP